VPRTAGRLVERTRQNTYTSVALTISGSYSVEAGGSSIGSFESSGPFESFEPFETFGSFETFG
jgi:hypothetical protein